VTSPSRRSALLAGHAALLATAFVVLPAVLAGGDFGNSFADAEPFARAAGRGIVEYWHTGAAAFPASLSAATDYWTRYHLAKAIIAALLLIPLGVLTFRSQRCGVRAALATLWTATLALVVANVQGVVAPFASLLSLVTPGSTPGDVAVTVDHIRVTLTGPHDAWGAHGAVLAAMVDDYAIFHVAMAIMMAIVAVAVAVHGVASARRTRLAVAATATAVAGLLLVTAANVSNAIEPVPGLAALLAGN
jgi:hypothetical protein